MAPNLTKCSKKQQKIIWTLSLMCGWALAYHGNPDPLSWVYGSFLVWALTAGPVWDRKAPFLVVGILGVASITLSWPIVSRDPWALGKDGIGLWMALAFLSSLCSLLGVRLQASHAKLKRLDDCLLPLARFSLWGRMTVSLGHEFRNQIAIVTGYLDQMKEDELLPGQERKIERSLLANEKMLHLLTQLRFMTRDASHDPQEALGLSEVLKDVLDFLDRPLQHRAITLSVTASPDLPRVTGQTALVQTLLVHLILHSLEHFHRSTQSDAKSIHVELTKQGDLICLHYCDNAATPKLWDEVGHRLAEHLILQQNGSLQEKQGEARGWEVLLYFKQAA